MSGGLDIDLVVGTILAVIGKPAGGDSAERVPLHEPLLAGNEWRYLRECLDTNWVSSEGPFVDRFERDLERFTGAPHAVAAVNGTAALHLALLLAGVAPGDEVLIPALTFVATANAVSYCGAVPHLVDSEETTLGLDPAKLAAYLEEIAGVETTAEGTVAVNRATGRRLRAVVPMHTFGFAMDLDPLAEVCARYGIVLVEDAAESLGTWYKGRHTGTIGRVAALSFNGNKIVTTGGGGAVLTADPELARLGKHLSTTAKLPHRWAYVHDRIGYNYRMPNLNAALGCAQLERLPEMLAQKRALAARYQSAFEAVPGVRFATEPAFSHSNYWLCALLLDEDGDDADIGGVAARRDALLAAADAAGIGARPPWTPMHKLAMFAGCPRMDLAVAESLAARTINLPSSARLGSAKG